MNTSWKSKTPLHRRVRILFPLAATFIACGDPTDLSTADTDCAAAIPETSGIDYGEPWEPPPDDDGDDEGGGVLDVAAGSEDGGPWDPDPDVAPGPGVNLVEELSLRDYGFRSSILADLAVSRPAGFTFNVPLPLDQVSDRLLGNKKLRQVRGQLWIPVTLELLGDTYAPSTVEVDQYRREVNNGVIYSVYGSTSTPGSYTSEDGDIHARALVDSAGGIYLSVLVEDTQLTVRGKPPAPSPSPRKRFTSAPQTAYLINVEVAETEMPALSIYSPPDDPLEPEDSTCHDGWDNDSSGEQDACDPTCMHHDDYNCASMDDAHIHESERALGLFGDGEWCERYAENDMWKLILTDAGNLGAWFHNQVAISQVPQDMISSSPFSGTGTDRKIPVTRLKLIGCYMGFESEAEAAFCHSSLTTEEECPGHPDYPFARNDNRTGVGGGSIGNGIQENYYLGAAWTYVQWIVDDHAGDIEVVAPIQMAGIVTVQFSEEGQLGHAFANFEDSLADALPLRGGFAVLDRGIGVLGNLVAHESAHTFGIGHVKKVGSFMYWYGAGGLPLLDDYMDCTGITDCTMASAWDGENLEMTPSFLTPAQVWGWLGSDKLMPRPSGGRFIGCDNNEDCNYYEEDRICKHVTNYQGEVGFCGVP